jgi:NitT/TauT family transport system permease protein
MAPFLFSAFRNVHALGWKIVVIAELFSQQVGIGAEYKRAYGFFELERLVVWTFFFIIMITTVEYVILRPLERRVFRWRAGPSASRRTAQPAVAAH